MIDLGVVFLALIFFGMFVCILGCFAIYHGFKFKYKDIEIFMYPMRPKEERKKVVYDAEYDMHFEIDDDEDHLHAKSKKKED